MVNVYVITGDLNKTIRRKHYPEAEHEFVDVFKEAIESHEKDKLELGVLTCISPTPKGHSKDTVWISTKSILRKVGFKVREA